MDRTVIGAKAGLLAGSIVGVISAILNTLDFYQLCLIKIGGGLFQKQMLSTNSTLGWMVLGWINHFVISAVLGMLFIYFLRYTDKGHARLKGIGFGAFIWTVDIAFMSPLLGYIPQNVRPIDFAIMLAYHLFFGYLTAMFIKRSPVWNQV